MEASKLLSAASNMPNSQAYGLLRCAAGKLIGGIEIRQKKGMERPGHAWVLGLIWFLFWIPEPIILLTKCYPRVSLAGLMLAKLVFIRVLFVAF